MMTRLKFGRAGSFWLLATLLALLSAASSAPSPLYAVYAALPPDPTGRTPGKQYAARYAVGCHLLYSDTRFPPRYTLLSFWKK